MEKSESAKNKLLKRIAEGYKPLAKTLEKYEITGVEAKPKPPKRDNSVYAKECYQRHRQEYIRKNLLYKIAHGHRPKESTLAKYGLPLDLHALHPMVVKRKSTPIVENGAQRTLE